MSYIHNILTVSTNDSEYAEDVAQRFRERGQTCYVDNRNIGIHKKMKEAELMKDCDFMIVISIISHEVDIINVRNIKKNRYVGDVYVKDFLHNLFCDKIKYKKNPR
jgi:threonyl-tRNA synthetase